MKRILLFLATNIAVMVVITLVLKLTGLDRATGLGGVLAASAVIGFAGSIISLMMSKQMAKMSVDAQVIEHPQNDCRVGTLKRQRQSFTQRNGGDGDCQRRKRFFDEYAPKFE